MMSTSTFGDTVLTSRPVTDINVPNMTTLLHPNLLARTPAIGPTKIIQNEIGL